MMKGLLLKDYYTLLKKVKIYLVILVVFSMMPNLSVVCFAVVYAAMLPITVLAYDEHAKWDSLAVMMPYSVRSIVLSKYVLGYIAIAAAAVISMCAQLVTRAVQHTAPAGEALLVVGVATGLALIFIALNLPLMFRLGVEKGRVAFFAFIAMATFTALLLGENMSSLQLPSTASDMGILIAGVTVALIALNALSIRLSMRWYKRRAV